MTKNSVIDKEICTYLKGERVGVLAVEMLDGSPHAATVHFAHTEDPFLFYFETYQEYRKAEPLFERDVSRASFVVGFNEDTPKTLQLDGRVSLLDPDNQHIFDDVYLGKFPEKVQKAKEGKLVCFSFSPTWWRFTDWTLPEGKKIWISE